MRPRTAIAFDAPDGLPVSQLLVLVVPEGGASDDHLQLLALVARLLSDLFFRSEIATAASCAEVEDAFRSAIARLTNRRKSNVAYAAYREYLGEYRKSSFSAFHVLDVIVATGDVRVVHQIILRFADASVLRCESLLHERNSHETDALRVRMMIRLALSSYAPVLHEVVEAVPSGEIGRLISWRDHLARRRLRHV